MATRVPIQSAQKPHAAFSPFLMILYMKIDQNWPSEFTDKLL